MLLIQLTFILARQKPIRIDVGVIGSFVGWINDIDMTSTNNVHHLNQYYEERDEFKVRQDNAYNIQWDNDQVAM